MAIYIGTDSDGFLTYENEPNEEQTLLKNINDVYPETELALLNETIEDITDEINELTNNINVTDISDEITLTPDVLCETVTLLKAVKTADSVFIQFEIKPSTNLSTVANCRFIVEGVTISAVPNYRFALGSDSTDFYFGWMYEIIENGFKVACKKIENSVWDATKTIELSGVFPTGIIENIEPTENNLAEGD